MHTHFLLLINQLVLNKNNSKHYINKNCSKKNNDKIHVYKQVSLTDMTNHANTGET